MNKRIFDDSGLKSGHVLQPQSVVQSGGTDGGTGGGGTTTIDLTQVENLLQTLVNNQSSTATTETLLQTLINGQPDLTNTETLLQTLIDNQNMNNLKHLIVCEMVDDTLNDGTALVNFWRVSMVTVDDAGVLTATPIGDYSDKALSAAYTPLGTVTERTDDGLTVRQGLVQLTGPTTWSPDASMLSYSISVEAGTPSYSDSFGSVKELDASSMLEYTQDQAGFDVTPVLTLEAGDTVCISYTQTSETGIVVVPPTGPFLTDLVPLNVAYAIPGNGVNDQFPVEAGSHFDKGVAEFRHKMNNWLNVDPVTGAITYDFSLFDVMAAGSPVPISSFHVFTFFRNHPPNLTYSGNPADPNYWGTIFQDAANALFAHIGNTYGNMEVVNEHIDVTAEREVNVLGAPEPLYTAILADPSLSDPKLYPVRIAQILRNAGFNLTFSFGDFSLESSAAIYPSTLPAGGDLSGAAGTAKWEHYLNRIPRWVNEDPTIEWQMRDQAHLYARVPYDQRTHLLRVQELSNLMQIPYLITEANLFEQNQNWHTADPVKFATRQFGLYTKGIYDKIGTDLECVGFWSDFAVNGETPLVIMDNGALTPMADDFITALSGVTPALDGGRKAIRVLGGYTTAELATRAPDSVTNATNSGQGIWGSGGNMRVDWSFYERAATTGPMTLVPSSSSTYALRMFAENNSGDLAQMFDAGDNLLYSVRSTGGTLEFFDGVTATPLGTFDNGRSVSVVFTQNGTNLEVAAQYFNTLNSEVTDIGYITTTLPSAADVSYFINPTTGAARFNSIELDADSVTGQQPMLDFALPGPIEWMTPRSQDLDWSLLPNTDMTAPTFSYADATVVTTDTSVGLPTITSDGGALEPYFTVAAPFTIDEMTGEVSQDNLPGGVYSVAVTMHAGALTTTETFNVTVTANVAPRFYGPELPIEVNNPSRWDLSQAGAGIYEKTLFQWAGLGGVDTPGWTLFTGDITRTSGTQQVRVYHWNDVTNVGDVVQEILPAADTAASFSVLYEVTIIEPELGRGLYLSANGWTGVVSNISYRKPVSVDVETATYTAGATTVIPLAGLAWDAASWTVISGDAVINGGNLEITPTAAGDFSITVEATNANGPTQQTYNLTAV